MARDEFKVSYIDIIFTFISILCRIISLCVNIRLAYYFYKHNYIDYFIWTTCCIIIPMVITTSLSIKIHCQDYKANKVNSKSNSIIEVFLYVILFPFMFRYCQALSYAIACKRAERRNDREEQKKYYEFMIHEDSDVALIRIFESYLEAAPQKLLQVSIILSGQDEWSVYQMVSIGGSFLSLTWCLVSYHRCNRVSQPDKKPISTSGLIIQCLWHFCVTVSRILSIALLVSIFPQWTLVGCFVHVIVMSLWIICLDRSPFCSERLICSYLFSLILGTVFIFTYILPKNVPRTRYRFLAFYLICAFENIACVVLAFIYLEKAAEITQRYFWALGIGSLLPYLIGIGFMILYYKRFHPNITCRLNDHQ